MKKAAIFDLNGVLIVGPLLSERIRDEKGIVPEDFMPALNDVMAKVRMPGAGNLFSYWEPYLKKWKVRMSEGEFLNFWFQPEKENVEMVVLCRELKNKGMELFVLSNNLRERSAYYEKNFSFLKELFNKEYYSWQTGLVKPDRRAFELILSENNLTPEDCIYFDDGAKNIEVGTTMGIESHLFKNASDTRIKIGLTSR